MTPMARETSRAVLGCVLILFLAAVAGCSDFDFWGKPEKVVDPNAFPENYKKDVLTYVKTHPRELLNAQQRCRRQREHATVNCREAPRWLEEALGVEK